ncbi:hypothetical protein [Nocardia vaccinii]|uniref:hypothetical protein n=1 Tax=Nocardia vaccinii TaxID=1822 RepID=UPI0008299CE8|nr:hypothetical protein [Nocardia vaccinii]
MEFNVTLSDPALVTPCFDDLMAVLGHTLRDLGHAVVDLGGFDPRRINIVFGYYLAPQAFSEPCIVYQLEPVTDNMVASGMVPVDLLRRHLVWDYNRRNIEQLRRYDVTAHYVPPGFHPVQRRLLPSTETSTDVLFYGKRTPRRARILELLREAGLRVRWVHDAYGPRLDPDIARSKVVLCLHSHEWMSVLESVRVTYLMANRKAVVAEVNPGDDADGLSDGILGVHYDGLVEACLSLVYDDLARAELEDAAFRTIAARPYLDVLARVIPRASPPAAVPVPGGVAGPGVAG